MKSRYLLVLLFIVFIGCAQQEYPIYDMHAHIQEVEQFDKFIKAMDQANISKVLLLGSPSSTILSGRTGFEGYDYYNDVVLTIAELYPERASALCTLYPKDDDKLNKLKECVERGSIGLKLYSGHSFFYEEDAPLNATFMDGVYSYLQENDLFIIWHVNPYYYQAEFEDVLKKYPKLRIICPHFCMSSINIERLEHLMDTYPQLYFDISFGAFAQDGLLRISQNIDKYKKVIEKYQDRVFFGIDIVVTDHPRKTKEWLTSIIMCYRNMLEKEEYYCKVGDDVDYVFNGLNLDKGVLKKIYYTNAEKFLSP
jgi:predicted TIM-barrel fold metal-dependent hydrolase